MEEKQIDMRIASCRIDQCLIFCRTNFDCDNLEAFFQSTGGGSGYRGKTEKGKENEYSCLVLAGQRSMQERREALQVLSHLLHCDSRKRGYDGWWPGIFRLKTETTQCVGQSSPGAKVADMDMLISVLGLNLTPSR